MAQVTFKSVSFNRNTPDEVVVSFNYNDANDALTACSVTKGQAGNVTIYSVINGDVSEVAQNAGFSLAPFGSVVKEIDPEFGDELIFLPAGLSFLVQYSGPAGMALQVAKGHGVA